MSGAGRRGQFHGGHRVVIHLAEAYRGVVEHEVAHFLQVACGIALYAGRAGHSEASDGEHGLFGLLVVAVAVLFDAPSVGVDGRVAHEVLCRHDVVGSHAARGDAEREYIGFVGDFEAPHVVVASGEGCGECRAGECPAGYL